MKTLDQKTLNENKAEAINKVHSFINDKVPLLGKEFGKGVKINKDNTICKKDKERIESILGEHNVIPKLRFYLSINDYSIYLSVDSWYYVSEKDRSGYQTCEYYKKNAYIHDRTDSRLYDFEPLELTDSQELTDLENELDTLEKQKIEIESRISDIKYKINK